MARVIGHCCPCAFRNLEKWNGGDVSFRFCIIDLGFPQATNDYVPSVGSKLLTSGETGDETAVRQATSAMFASGSAAVRQFMLTLAPV